MDLTIKSFKLVLFKYIFELNDFGNSLLLFHQICFAVFLGNLLLKPSLLTNQQLPRHLKYLGQLIRRLQLDFLLQILGTLKELENNRLILELHLHLLLWLSITMSEHSNYGSEFPLDAFVGVDLLWSVGSLFFLA